MITLILFSVLIIHFYLKFQKRFTNYERCDCGSRIVFPGMLFTALTLLNINGFAQTSNFVNTNELTGDFYYLEIADDRTYLGIIIDENEKTVTIETKEMRIIKFEKSSVLSCEIVTWRKSKGVKKWVKNLETNPNEPIWFTDLAKDLI